VPAEDQQFPMLCGPSADQGHFEAADLVASGTGSHGRRVRRGSAWHDRLPTPGR
jgi:hypothetical protein